MQDARTESYARTIERCRRALSAPNKDLLERFLRDRAATNVRVSTQRSYAEALARLDAFTGGKPMRDVTTDDLSAFFVRMQATYAETTIHSARTYLRAFFRWLYEDLERDVPRPMQRVFRARRQHYLSPRKLVTDPEFQALLNVCRGDTHQEAILWVLRDAGFRVGELVALNVGSVEFHDDGTASLTLPEDGLHLKTGPRTVPVKRCVGLLRRLLELHPAREDPAASLFYTSNVRARGHRYRTQSINQFLRRHARSAGVRHIKPHDLRHTRVTEAARNGMNEAKLRLLFGWSKSSPMPGHYVHLVSADLRQDIRAEGQPAAPMSGSPPPPPSGPPQPKPSIAKLLLKLLAEAPELMDA